MFLWSVGLPGALEWRALGVVGVCLGGVGMKLHRVAPLVVLLVVAMLGVFGVASCGTESDSVFNDPNLTADSGGPDPPPFTGNTDGGGDNGCKKLTCADLKINCGPAGDGCGGKLDDCGKGAPPQTCGGGGSAGSC